MSNMEDETFLSNFVFAILLTLIAIVISLDIKFIMEYIRGFL